ncbi:family 78 glycoside hydrolase catalytic domain [Parabacteroides pacaensis]|uniref:family 78 glycoside hydrolase catalytic domain n=1 Tax=Parabacteroides pacaensis TaxID=2086575 RepID=UPI000D0FF770|nr:family 78 glycoside hydrolase catalytic domain [Parabacteroides pacaensis]
MKTPLKTHSFILSFFLLLFLSCNPAEMKVQELTCEYLNTPLAVDTPAPLLSWQLQSTHRGKHQTAYHILVADSPELLKKDQGNIWDSGITQSSRSTRIKYEGKTLTSRSQLYWKVKVWDEQGQPGAWSETAQWEMGLLKSSDWTARWIAPEEDPQPDSSATAPAPYFRKTFSTEKPIRKARIYVCGLGFYELYLNGNRVGDQVLAPAVTNYDKRPLKNLLYHYDDQSTQRCLYNTFDITPLLSEGDNTLGILLGNGWYNQRDRRVEGDMWYDTPRVIAQVEIEYADGTIRTIPTDKTWKVTRGPLLHNGIFTGETYDARLELGNWSENTYKDDHWNPALEVRPPSGTLRSQMAPFDKIVRTITPAFEKKKNDSTYLYSLPETVAGWVQLNVQGKAGSQVKLRFIAEEGEDYGQSDTYILKGEGPEQWEPRFTWHAFRSFEVISPDVAIDTTNLLVKVVNTDVPRSGDFHCSNELFNKIHEAYIRTQDANFHGSISSDCPHRERLGYTGDGQVIAESSLFTYDMTQFYKKWLDDIEDARNHKTGYVTHTAPFAGGGGGPAWGSAYIIMPWLYYNHYADKALLEQHYDGMKQWIAYLSTRTDEKGIVVREEPNGWCLGDWCTPGRVEIPEPLVNTAYYYHCTRLMCRIATLLGREKDALSFTKQAAQIKENYHKAFFNPETNHYWEGRQGADVFSLAFDLVPEENKQPVFNALSEHLAKINYHFDTGILATPLLLKVLTRYGRADLAYRVMNQRTAPGFAYVLDDRNSTLWERWDGAASRCHPMFGSVVAWFYNTLAGIDVENSEIETRHLDIKPHMVDGMDFCKASYHSLYGLIRSEWEKDKNGTIRLTVEIPANMTATVHIPRNKTHLIYESNTPVKEVENITILESTSEEMIVKVGSGIYLFTVKNSSL